MAPSEPHRAAPAPSGDPSDEAGAPAQPRQVHLFEVASDRAGFVRAARADEVPPHGGLAVLVAGREVALFRVQGAIHAISDLCPHQYASLAEGTLAGPVVICPLHAWRFDVRTGGPPGGAGDFPRVDRYRVLVEGGVVYVDPTPRRGADPGGPTAPPAPASGSWPGPCAPGCDGPPSPGA